MSGTIGRVGLILALILCTGATPQTQPTSQTYCNPLSLPDYPIGKRCRDVARGSPVGAGRWLLDHCEQYRELADPSALWFDGKWYLYPSVDMAWISADGGATWTHHPLNVRDLGYAPTIVRHRDRFLLLASGSEVHSSDSPLGPFTPIGKIQLPDGLPSQTDPMLFSDEDGRLYYYWGCTPTRGIYGVELDAANPTRVVGTPAKLIAFEPDKQPWQCLGDWNEDINRGWLEGAWMLKRNGTYYLTYSAGGTVFRTYAMGCARGKSPLGPFESQKNNPILRSTSGLITGTAHGCIVEGPNKALWAFYSIRAGVAHGFERRIGMDPAYIDAGGELHVTGPSSSPRRLPAGANSTNDPGWLPLNVGHRTIGSSTSPGMFGRFSVDEDLRTWWQPADDDTTPALTTHLESACTVNAVRIIWRDIGLDTLTNAHPGPFRYRIELMTAPNIWIPILDRSASTEDLLIDYRECPPTVGTRVRLSIVGSAKGITPGVAEFTVFGNVVKKAP